MLVRGMGVHYGILEVHIKQFATMINLKPLNWSEKEILIVHRLR